MDLAVVRALHVVAVVLWIGGVAMVTTSVLPALRTAAAAGDALALFERIERPFAWQSRITTLLAGLSGFYMVHRMDAWDRFADPRFWWMHAMVAVWLLFSLMLFVAEPLWLHAWLRRRASVDPRGTLRLVLKLHRGLLLLSLITVAGAVAGAHGF